MGLKFLQNIAEYAAKGATLDFKYPTSIRFPQKAMMNYETDEYLITSPDIQVIPIDLEYTKEMLEALDWEVFKRTVAKAGVGGRARDIMTNQYLKKLEEQKDLA